MDHSLKSLSKEIYSKGNIIYVFNNLKLLLVNHYVWLVLFQNLFGFVVSIILKTTSTLPFKSTFGEKKKLIRFFKIGILALK